MQCNKDAKKLKWGQIPINGHNAFLKLNWGHIKQRMVPMAAWAMPPENQRH
jgi:hypothetical protein